MFSLNWIFIGLCNVKKKKTAEIWSETFHERNVTKNVIVEEVLVKWMLQFGLPSAVWHSSSWTQTMCMTQDNKWTWNLSFDHLHHTAGHSYHRSLALISCISKCSYAHITTRLQICIRAWINLNLSFTSLKVVPSLHLRVWVEWSVVWCVCVTLNWII